MATLNPFKNCLSQSLIQNENIHGCRSGEISLPKIQVAVSCSKAYRFKKFREHLYCWVIDKPTDQQTNAKTEPPWREKINAESLNFVTIRSNIQRYPLVLGTCSKPPVYGWGSDPPPLSALPISRRVRCSLAMSSTRRIDFSSSMWSGYTGLIWSSDYSFRLGLSFRSSYSSVATFFLWRIDSWVGGKTDSQTVFARRDIYK